MNEFRSLKYTQNKDEGKINAVKNDYRNFLQRRKLGRLKVF